MREQYYSVLSITVTEPQWYLYHYDDRLRFEARHLYWCDNLSEQFWEDRVMSA